MAVDRGMPLPKFGEWDVNNPASADGFTVIFSKARDEKKTSGDGTGAAVNAAAARRNNSAYQKKNDQKMKPQPSKKIWSCFG
ncbi:hypothetical protein MLD38_027666 [Melastoma candidum]|uniref:Uncharacterized protein n=1 Tax=Melastoma candidum TaxID=119954 RepID=A0ACB9P3R7_9MYRT|nr:hypothetical protein MLD38_027666 [Melastoma candidum]